MTDKHQETKVTQACICGAHIVLENIPNSVEIAQRWMDTHQHDATAGPYGSHSTTESRYHNRYIGFTAAE